MIVCKRKEAKIKLLEKEPSTDTSEGSPEKHVFLSPQKSHKGKLEISSDKYAQKQEKRKMILSTIRQKLKISNILNYVIEQCPETGEITLFSDVYKIKGLLGVGGFGVVLAVHNLLTDEESALKICMKSEYARIINKEGEVLSSLNHGGIIKFKNIYETKSRFLLEMELWRGGHIRKVQSKWKNGVFSEDDTLTIMQKLLGAVSYIHSKDYIHRDIKPENVLFAKKNDLSSLKLVDFGLSTIYPAMLTQTVKDKIGTLLFMAPEQTDYSSYTKKVDIWAWGIIMYQLLTGKHPFYQKGDTESSYLAKLRVQKNLELPDDVEVSDLWRDFLTRLCKYSPTERYEAHLALSHPWITGDHEAELPLTPIEKLKMVNAEFQLKNAMNVLFAAAVLKARINDADEDDASDRTHVLTSLKSGEFKPAISKFFKQ